MGDVVMFNKCQKFNKNSQGVGDFDDRDCIGLKELSIKLECTNKIIGIVGSVLGILITVLIFGMNAKYDAINTTINSKMELINQKLESQKEINSLQIQRDVQVYTKTQHN